MDAKASIRTAASTHLLYKERTAPLFDGGFGRKQAGQNLWSWSGLSVVTVPNAYANRSSLRKRRFYQPVTAKSWAF